jgi:hypothetical protein
MTKLRCAGLVLLVLLISAQGFTSNANQNFTNEFSISGNIKVRGTPSGHLTVAVDQSFPMREIEGDGIPDIAFHFAPKKSSIVYQNIAFDLEQATLTFTGRRLTVLSTDRHILLNITLEKGPESNASGQYYDDRSRDLPETLRISRGKALGQYKDPTTIQALWLCGTKGGECSVLENTGEMRIADDPIEIEGPCPSGGTGSTSCSIECGAGQGCSTSCGAGYYACCHCTNGCHCIHN